jgi:hypothetical protein
MIIRLGPFPLVILHNLLWYYDPTTPLVLRNFSIVCVIPYIHEPIINHRMTFSPTSTVPHVLALHIALGLTFMPSVTNELIVI